MDFLGSLFGGGGGGGGGKTASASSTSGLSPVYNTDLTPVIPWLVGGAVVCVLLLAVLFSGKRN